MPTGMSCCALSQALWHAAMLGSKALACWHVTPLHNTGAGLSQGSRVLSVIMADLLYSAVYGSCGCSLQLCCSSPCVGRCACSALKDELLGAACKFILASTSPHIAKCPMRILVAADSMLVAGGSVCRRMSHGQLRAVGWWQVLSG